MNRRHGIQLGICLCLIFLNLSFIWGNSMLAGPQSAEVSEGLLEVLEEFLEETIPGGHMLLRKLAHFTEFASLGLLLAWLFLLLGQQSFHKFTMPLLCGILTALTDESIQMLTPERGPGVADVLIDTAGALTGILILLLGHCLWQMKKQKSNGGNET